VTPTTRQDTAVELRAAIEKQAHRRARLLLDRYAIEVLEKLATLPPRQALQAAESAESLLRWALLATRCALAHDQTELMRLNARPVYGEFTQDRSGTFDLQG
jgi:hypothetical protein